MASRPKTLIGSHDGAVESLVVTAHRVISAARDGSVVAWDPTQPDCGESLLTSQDQPGWFHRLAAPAGGHWIVAGHTLGGIARFVLGPKAAAPFELPGMEEGVCDVALSPDGQIIAASGDSNTVRMYDADDAPLWQGETYKWTYALAFAGDGSQLYAGTWDSYLYSIPLDPLPQSDPEEPDVPVVLPYPTTPSPDGIVFDVVALDDADVGVSGVTHDGQGYVSVGPLANLKRLCTTADGIHCLARSQDGRWLAAGGNDQRVRVWSLSDREQVAEWQFGDYARQPEIDFRAERQAARQASPPLDLSIYPAFADYYAASGPGAVHAVAFGESNTLYAGTHGGEVWMLPVAD